MTDMTEIFNFIRENKNQTKKDIQNKFLTKEKAKEIRQLMIKILENENILYENNQLNWVDDVQEVKRIKDQKHQEVQKYVFEQLKENPVLREDQLLAELQKDNKYDYYTFNRVIKSMKKNKHIKREKDGKNIQIKSFFSGKQLQIREYIENNLCQGVVYVNQMKKEILEKFEISDNKTLKRILNMINKQRTIQKNNYIGVQSVLFYEDMQQHYEQQNQQFLEDYARLDQYLQQIPLGDNVVIQDMKNLLQYQQFNLHDFIRYFNKQNKDFKMQYESLTNQENKKEKVMKKKQGGENRMKKELSVEQMMQQVFQQSAQTLVDDQQIGQLVEKFFELSKQWSNSRTQFEDQLKQQGLQYVFCELIQKMQLPVVQKPQQSLQENSDKKNKTTKTKVTK